jgi:tRNA A-37 threonylcarbamoyl transferase component Bud32
MANNSDSDPTRPDISAPLSNAETASQDAPITPPQQEPPVTRIEPSSLQTVFGDYELLREIARGGMGVVWKARQRSLNRIVALKMILDARLSSDDAIQRFLTEARAAAVLDHPNIVPVYEVGRIDDRHFFSMAFVDGKNLTELVDTRGPMPVHDAAAVTRAVADAIHYAHTHSIIHRDLKPSNVLIDSHGRPRVTDFGLAKCLSEVGGLTGAGQVLGTPAFMAPEQALGKNQEVGPRADVYALGGLLYFLLTGDAPFDGDSAASILHQVAFQPPPSPRILRPEVPPELEAICMRCLEKDPLERYSSAAEVVEALTPWCIPSASPSTPAPSSATEIVTPTAPTPPVHRWLPVVVFGAVVVVAALGLGWYAKQRWGGQQQQVAAAPQSSEPAARATRPANPPAPAVEPVVLEPQFKDFNLDVTLVGKEPDKQGIYHLTEGDVVQFRIKADRDAYVLMCDIGANGNVEQLFPVEGEGDGKVRGNVPQVLPELDVTPEPRDRVFIIASTRPLRKLAGKPIDALHLIEQGAPRKKWVEMVVRGHRDLRGLKPKVPNPDFALSEAVLRYQVEPKMK